MEIKEFDDLCLEFQRLKDEKSEYVRIAKDLEVHIAEKERAILSELETNELDRFSFSNGLVSTTHNLSYSKVDKVAFKNYMKEKGLWEGLADINSQTLKATLKVEEAKEREKGNFDFQVPGLEISTISKISIRRKS